MEIERVWLILGVCLTVITILGVFGNTLSFLVWTKGKRCSSCQGAIYLRLLALSDILVLCVPAMELNINLLEPNILLRNLNPVFCKVVPISPYFCVQVSAWIVVCLTVEQTVAVCRPFKSMTSSSRWRHYGLVVTIVVVSFLDNIPLLVFYEWGMEKEYTLADNISDAIFTGSTAVSNSVNNSFGSLESVTPGTNYDTQIDEGNEQNFICVGRTMSPEHVYIVQLGIIAILPILTLIACNIIIIAKLFRRDKKLTKIASRKDRQNKNSLLATMTARTVAIGIVQCLTSIPIVAMDIYFLFHHWDSTTSMIYDICNTTYYLNNAINVIFYCLLGRSFRQDCLDLFTGEPKHGVRAGLGLAAIETVTSSVM